LPARADRAPDPLPFVLIGRLEGGSAAPNPVQRHNLMIDWTG
jgi:hypothetical protein